MAFYVKFKRKRSVEDHAEWHINENAFTGLTGTFNQLLDDVEFLQADGHELQEIQKIFSKDVSNGFPYSSTAVYSIPMSHKPVQRWYGDIAKTILFSL